MNQEAVEPDRFTLKHIKTINTEGPTWSIIPIRWKTDPFRVGLATGEERSYKINIWDVVRGPSDHIYKALFFIKYKTDLYKKKFILRTVANMTSTPSPRLMKVVATLEGHSHCVNVMLQLDHYEFDSTIIASGSWDSTIKLWNLEQRTNYMTLALKDGSNVRTLMQWQENTLLSGHTNKQIAQWNIKTGEQMQVITIFEAEARCFLKLSEDMFLAGSYDKKIKVMNSELKAQGTFSIHQGSVLAMIFYKHKPVQIASSDSEGVIAVWTPEKGEVIHSWTAHRDYIYSLAKADFDGTECLLSASHDGFVKIWNKDFNATFATSWLESAFVVYYTQFDKEWNYVLTGDTRNQLQIFYLKTYPKK